MDTGLNANGIARGYACNEKEEKRLKAAGIKIIYRGDRDETLGKFKMRSGECLGVIDGLRAFGDGRRDMVAAVKLVHSWGAVIVDVDTGARSDRDGAEMLHKAISPNHLSPEAAALMQAKSAEARKRNRVRMPDREALVFWRNPRLSTLEAIDLMPGWSVSAAYRDLGERGVPAGRRGTRRNTAPIADRKPNFKPSPKRGRSGKVYFIQAGVGPVKIGFATDVKARMSGLQTSTHARLKLLHVIDGTTKTEGDFHSRFSEYRLEGEWFKYAGKLKKFLAEVTKRKR